MIRDSQRVSDSIKDQLDLKRTRASMKDARTGFIISVGVAGFTIISIIFTPSSFIISLLALSVDRFAKHRYDFAPNASAPNVTLRTYHSYYVGEWISVTEVVSICVTILVVIVTMWSGGAFTFKGSPAAAPKRTSKKPASTAPFLAPALVGKPAVATHLGNDPKGGGEDAENRRRTRFIRGLFRESADKSLVQEVEP